MMHFCRLNELKVTKKTKKAAEGTIKYENCVYDTGEKLVGTEGTWTASPEAPKKEEGVDYVDDDEEYVYQDSL